MLDAMALRVVVLGTGTGVGKTHVACELARAATREFESVVALKPIETGVSGETPAADATALWVASGRNRVDGPEPAYCFAPAISAHLAAREAGVRIDVGAILDWVADQERRFHTSDSRRGLTLIETAGGAYSPLADGVSNLDLAQALSPCRWLLVAPDALGVLHDLTATLSAMRTTARGPDAIVLSAARPADASTGSNAGELRLLGIAQPAATFERGTTPNLRALWDSLRA